MLTEEIGGFYDPRRKTLFLIVEIPEDGETIKEPGAFARLFGARPRFDPNEQKIVLLHEMSHALMDQHYDIKNTQESLQDDDDASLAYTALVEGEATLMMMLPGLGSCHYAKCRPIFLSAGAGETLKPGLQASLHF